MPRQTGKIKLDGVFADRKLAPQRHVWLPGGWWLWCLLGLAVGLSGWIGSRHYLRTQLSQQLASAETEQVALQSIEALLRLDGDAAIDVSRSLAHPEFMVANAAFRALNQQLDAWERLAAGERLRRMTQVIAELERTPPDLDEDHRILINGLASRIYAETLSNRESGAADLLSSCKRIMARSGGRAQPQVLTQVTARDPLSSAAGSLSDGELDSPVPPPLPPLREADADAPASADSTTSPTSAQRSEAHLAPGLSGMPRLTSTAGEHVALSSGRATVQLTATPSRDSSITETRQVPETHHALEAHQALELRDEPPLENALQQRKLSDASEETAIDDRAAEEEASGSSAPIEDSTEDGTLAGIDDLPIDQLVRLLSSVQPRVAQAASLALRRKGMSDDKLALAMKLATGSSAERQEMLRGLVERKDLDPRPWLLWMSSDGDSHVREQAVGLLSPLLDNDVRRQLRLLLNTERDERVAQTIRRVLVQ